MADRSKRTSRGTPGASARPSGRPVGRSQRRTTATPGRTPAAAVPAVSSVGQAPVPTGRRRPRLTGRAAILILLLAVLTVSYASSMRAYLQQRSHIADLKAEIAETSASINDLEREKTRWHDPAFLEQQARERFGFVFPGETRYQVIDDDGKVLKGGETLHDPDKVVKQAPTAWWDTAWKSMELAGDPATADSGPPAPGP